MARLAQLETLWLTLRKPDIAASRAPTSLSEREAHERAAWVYGYWLNLHRENPSSQTLWNTDVYDRLWRPKSVAVDAQRRDLGDQLAIADMHGWCRRHADTV